jgi:TonB family protein
MPTVELPASRVERANVIADPPPEPIMSSHYAEEYALNEIKADGEYKGQRIDISGFVVKVDEGFDDRGIVTLREYFDIPAVTAVLAPGEKDNAAKLEVGGGAHMLCIGMGIIMGRATVGECHIIPLAQPKDKAPANQADEAGPAAPLYTIGGAISAPRFKSVQPIYGTPEAKATTVHGSVTVEFLVDTQGNPSDVNVVSGLTPALDLLVVNAVSRSTFFPALLNGKDPVRVKFRTTANF